MGLLVLNLATGCLLLASLFVPLVSSSPAYYSDFQNRILGGSETISEFFPFQLALESFGRQLCGGSVLSSHWALTAAHCVADIQSRWLVFRAGSDRLLTGGTLHPVKEFKVHEQYSKSQSLSYDVAVVKVRKPFIYTKKLLPVQLPMRAPVQGDMTWVAGWGYTEKEKLKKPDQLLMIDIEVFSWEDCEHVYRDNLSPTMMCAGSLNKNTCNGDSGGPLVRGYDEQVGIVSWGYECGDGLPTVFTNVSTVTDWIVDKTDLLDYYKSLDNDILIFPSD